MRHLGGKLKIQRFHSCNTVDAYNRTPVHISRIDTGDTVSRCPLTGSGQVGSGPQTKMAEAGEIDSNTEAFPRFCRSRGQQSRAKDSRKGRKAYAESETKWPDPRTVRGPTPGAGPAGLGGSVWREGLLDGAGELVAPVRDGVGRATQPGEHDLGGLVGPAVEALVGVAVLADGRPLQGDAGK